MTTDAQIFGIHTETLHSNTYSPPPPVKAQVFGIHTEALVRLSATDFGDWVVGFMPIASPSQSRTTEIITITNGDDDGEVTGGAGYSATGNSVRIGEAGVGGLTCYAWYRFPSIPAMNQCLSARVTLTATTRRPEGNDIAEYSPGVFTPGNGYGDIYAEDVAAPVAPITNGDYFAKVVTSTKVDWTHPATEVGQEIMTPDLVDIVNELLASYGTLTAIQILHKVDTISTATERVLSVYTHEGGFAPRLELVYQ